MERRKRRFISTTSMKKCVGLDWSGSPCRDQSSRPVREKMAMARNGRSRPPYPGGGQLRFTVHSMFDCSNWSWSLREGSRTNRVELECFASNARAVPEVQAILPRGASVCRVMDYRSAAGFPADRRVCNSYNPRLNSRCGMIDCVSSGALQALTLQAPFRSLS